MVLALFFLSGCSGLIYEIVWVRQLTTIFGATQLAVATVLAAFMGGLAFGSRMGGKLIDRDFNPLKFYALLEFGIALLALALLWIVHALEPLYLLIHRLTDESYIAFSLARFVLNFIILFIPTTMMGATLPVLSRMMASEVRTAGLWTGGLYALNTLGAVLGCLWAGFIGIAALGITKTVICAAGINLAVGLTAAILSRIRPSLSSSNPPLLEDKRPASTAAAIYPPRVLKVLTLSYALSGMVAMGYQVLWTRTLVFSFQYASNTTYAFTAMLAVFLLGLAVGSGIISLVGNRGPDPLKSYAFLQILTGLSIIGSLYLIAVVLPDLSFPAVIDPNTLEVDWTRNMLSIFIKAGLAMLPTTTLIGMMLPLVVKIMITDMQNMGATIGKIYAFNTVGAIFGAFVTGFVVIPLFGLTKSMLLYASINGLIGTVLLSFLHLSSKRKQILWSAAPAAFAAFALILLWFSGNIVFHRPSALEASQFPEKLVFYKEGPLDTVSVYETELNGKALFIDSRAVAGTNKIMLTDQKTMAHLPMLLLDDPKTALDFGFGSGGTAWSFLQHDSLQRLDVVEISPTILDAAPHLRESNNGLLDFPIDCRLNILRKDARNYLRMNDVLYDIVEIDCTDLRYKENSDLYSVEFFQYCRKRLNHNGMALAWFPIAKISNTALRSVLRTFHQAFPYLTVWYFNNYSTHYIILLGAMEPLIIDYQKFLDKLEQPKIRRDLETIGLSSPYKILSSYVTDQDGLAPALRDAPLNTEDRPYLEFHVPRDKTYLDNSQKVRNLTMLMSMRNDIYPLIANIPPARAREFREKMSRYYRALPFLIQGHNHMDMDNHELAARFYERAISINPEDASIYLQY